MGLTPPRIYFGIGFFFCMYVHYSFFSTVVLVVLFSFLSPPSSPSSSLLHTSLSVPFFFVPFTVRRSPFYRLPFTYLDTIHRTNSASPQSIHSSTIQYIHSLCMLLNLLNTNYYDTSQAR
ncbi:hypothetical protein B0H19DRAFT_246887 [Mycena capillaripes]|nr:hypothetical protein B0H19DRAFT_246887 [Mycena capillaripes]